MFEFKIPLTRIRLLFFRGAFLNVWIENPLYGTMWSLHILPVRKFWKWGAKCRSGSYLTIRDSGFGPIYRLIRFF